MEAKELFLMVEQSRNLRELGLDMSDAVFAWDMSFNGTVAQGPVVNNESNRKRMDLEPTYTLQEVLNHIEKLLKKYEMITYDDTLDGAYKVLCRMLERERDDMKPNLEPTYEGGLVFDEVESEGFFSEEKEYTVIKRRKKHGVEI